MTPQRHMAVGFVDHVFMTGTRSSTSTLTSLNGVVSLYVGTRDAGAAVDVTRPLALLVQVPQFSRRSQQRPPWQGTTRRARSCWRRRSDGHSSPVCRTARNAVNKDTRRDAVDDVLVTRTKTWTWNPAGNSRHHCRTVRRSAGQTGSARSARCGRTAAWFLHRWGRGGPC